jgi:hypothetical protein
LYHAYFQSDPKAEYPVVFETKGGAKIEFGLKALVYMDDVSKEYFVIEECLPVKPLVSGSEIIFPNIFKNIDLKYVYHDTRIEELVILKPQARQLLPGAATFGLDKENAYLMLLTKVNLKGSLNAYLAKEKIKNKNALETENRINFKNIKGEVKFFMPSDYAYLQKHAGTDSTEDLMSQRMKRRLISVKKENYILSGVPVNWIENQPQGSIILDPQVEIYFEPDGARGKDTWICSYSSYQNKNAGGSGRLQVENGSNIWKSLLKFVEVENYIPQGATIETATCSLRCYFNSCSNCLDLHCVTHSWLEGSGTAWNGNTNSPTINGVTWLERWYGDNTNNGNNPFSETDPDWQTLGGDYESTPVDANKSASAGNWVTWDVKTLVQDWVDGDKENHGMIIQSDTYFGYVRFNSAETGYPYTSYRPKLYIQYQVSDPSPTYYIRDAAGNVIATYKMPEES